MALLAPAAVMAEAKPIDPNVVNAIKGFASDLTATDVMAHTLSGGNTLAEFNRANVGYQLLIDGTGGIDQVMETQSYRP